MPIIYLQQITNIFITIINNKKITAPHASLAISTDTWRRIQHIGIDITTVVPGGQGAAVDKQQQQA
jgi:hypothetical protein